MTGDNLSGKATGAKEDEIQQQPEIQGSVEFSLEHILGDDHDALDHPGLKRQEPNCTSTAAEGWDEESINMPPIEGYCIECEGEYSIPSKSYCCI